jgi:two-component system, NarL family, sensor kinase
MPSTTYDLTYTILATTFLLLLLAGFILTVLFLYQKKQITYLRDLEFIKSESEKAILNTQLEIQEQTLQHISREIHDNICLNLTLAKLNLVTIESFNSHHVNERINSSVELLSSSIRELSDISHSMNPELIESFGLIKTLEIEIEKVERLGLLNITYHVGGNPVFMNSQKEVVIFRIIQEAFNNILKHAKAKNVLIKLYYNESQIEVTVQDDGVGFIADNSSGKETLKAKSGLLNMRKRAKLIEGICDITTEPGNGTIIHISIPY